MSCYVFLKLFLENALAVRPCNCKAPGDGLGIFTDRDQRSIFCVLHFENLYFLVTGHSSCIFFFLGGGLLNKRYIFRVF